MDITTSRTISEIARERFEMGLVRHYNEESEKEANEALHEEISRLRKERDELINGYMRQQNDHEEELARLESRHQKEMEALVQEFKASQKALAEASQSQESQPVTIPQLKSFTIAQMAVHVKECFDKTSAEEFVYMFYHLSTQDGAIDEEASKIVDGIIPHIMLRDRHHTHVDIPSAGQVYINTQNVHNHTKDEEKEK